MSSLPNPVKSSILLPALRQAGKRPYRVRKLSAEEFEQLERQGCRCADWHGVKVSLDFRADRIHDVEFRGEVLIGRLYGKVEIDGWKENSGLSRTTLEDVWLEDGVVIRDTLLVSGMRVGHGTAILGCGVVRHQPGANFGVGSQIPLVETGGRVTHSYPEMTLKEAEQTARPAGNISGLAAHLRRVEAYAARAASAYGVIQSGVSIIDTPRVENVFIGHHARIRSAQRVSDSVVLSDANHEATIEDGSIVTESVVQWGCRVSSSAIVERSVLCEYSAVERQGKFIQSILGPNSVVAEGEVTSSLLGPFVGFHHQALLIGVVWPEGKGNVAYGCNCGSNHTGKAPDQEFWPGEGMFLGLGVNVKFPGCFTEAPYTMVATGVSLLPQRVEYPFSLIVEPTHRPDKVPEGFNELFPAWVLAQNLFAVKRNELKFRERDRSFRNPIDYRIFRKETVELMIRARDRLSNLDSKDYYTEGEDPGLGKNFMTEESRMAGMETYGCHIRLYALEGLFRRLRNRKKVPSRILKRRSADPEWEFQRRILQHEVEENSPEGCLRLYLKYLEQVADEVQESKARDDRRGMRIIPDYEDHHILAHENPFVRRFQDEIEAIEDEVLDLLGQ